MVFTHLIGWLLNAIIGAAVIALGLLTYDDPLAFDRAFILVLILTAVLCRRDPNALSLIVILFVARALDELFFSLIDDPNIQLKVILYILLGFTFYKLKHDKVSYLNFVALGLCAFMEVYWWSMGVEPLMVFLYLIVITIEEIIRYGMVYRTFILERIVPGQSIALLADEAITLVASLKIVMCTLVLFEFALEAFLNIKVYWFYSAYPVIAQILSCLVIYILFKQAAYAFLQRSLQA